MPRPWRSAYGSRCCVLLAMAVAHGLAFPRAIKWDQVSSLFLPAPAPSRTTQPARGHQCQLPVPLETCFVPRTLLRHNIGRWLGAAERLDLPFGLAAKTGAVFYSRLGFFLLKDNLRLNREPLKMWMSC